MCRFKIPMHIDKTGRRNCFKSDWYLYNILCIHLVNGSEFVNSLIVDLNEMWSAVKFGHDKPRQN